MLPLRYGGESGIRTHVTLSSKHAFQACAFSHSAISPAKPQEDDNVRELSPAQIGIEQCRFALQFILWACAHECKLTTVVLDLSRLNGEEKSLRKFWCGYGVGPVGIRRSVRHTR